MARSVKKGPFVDDHLMKKVQALNEANREERDQDLVAALDDHPGHDRAHLRGPQRAQVHSRVRHREHGRPQARRVLADANVPRPFRRPEDGSSVDRGAGSDCGGRAGSRRAGRTESVIRMEAKSIGRFVRISPQKARLVGDLIRGKRVEEALSVLEFTPRRRAKLVAKMLRSADRQRGEQQEPRRRHAVREAHRGRPGPDPETLLAACAGARDAAS